MLDFFSVVFLRVLKFEKEFIFLSLWGFFKGLLW